MQGLRFNDGKRQWSLVDFEALEPMVEVLEFGAKKYTKVFVPLLEQKLKPWNATAVKEKGRYVLEDSVIHVMNKNCSMQIRITKNEEPTTKRSIVRRIENGLRNITGNENSLEETILNIDVRKETLTIEGSTASVHPNTTSSKQKVVNYVENVMEPCTLTTTIPLEGLELCCVVSATTDLDSLTMMLNFLNGVLDTSFQVEILTETGQHNWKKGLPITQICESMLRHVHAVLKGEDVDPESGISHTGHILCNAMFLSHMMSNRPDMDDRYKEKEVVTNEACCGDWDENGICTCKTPDPNQLSLFELAKETPNDSEFGRKVREQISSNE